MLLICCTCIICSSFGLWRLAVQINIEKLPALTTLMMPLGLNDHSLMLSITFTVSILHISLMCVMCYGWQHYELSKACYTAGGSLVNNACQSLSEKTDLIQTFSVVTHLFLGNLNLFSCILSIYTQNKAPFDTWASIKQSQLADHSDCDQHGLHIVFLKESSQIVIGESHLCIFQYDPYHIL